MPGGTASRLERRDKGSTERYLIVAAMFLFSAVSYGRVAPQESNALLVLASIMSYFLAIYLYYGVARLALANQSTLLWTSGVLAVATGYLLGGTSELWLLLTGWGMILFGGVLTGRLTASGRPAGRIYLIAIFAVGVFAVVQLAPFWSFLMDKVRSVTASLLEDGRQSLLASGYGEDAIKGGLEDTQKMMNLLVRLVPALTVLAAIAQFSIGYFLFAYRLDRAHYPEGTLSPFVRWKMPFWVTPVLMIVILTRLLGPTSVHIVADNLIAFLCVFYCVTGLSLIESYLTKFHFSKLMKALFYIMLVFTQLIGFFAAALLGFIDSFADWRKIHQLSIAKE